MNYAIKVEPEVSLMDKDVEIKITGMPGESLEVCFFTEDYYNINGDIREMEVGTKWESTVTVKLNHEGQKRLDAVAFTTLKIKEPKKSILEQQLTKLSTNRSCHIQMTLKKQGKTVASVLHERCYCDKSIVSKDVVSEQLLGRYFTSKKFEKRPAVIVVSGSDGRIEKAQAIAECLAMKGYSTFALCYFGMAQVPPNLTQIPMEYIEHAIHWLEQQETVDSNRIGIYGRSKGGEMVLLAASLFPQLKYVVANTPSNFVQEGIIGGKSTSHHSSWCYEGKELPYVKAGIGSIISLLAGFVQKDPFAFRKFYDRVTWRHEKERMPEARIKLEKSKASFLFVSSDTDGIWPSNRYAQSACNYIKKSDLDKKIKHLCYQGSGHMLTLPYQPIPNCEEYGGTLEKGVPATIDCWRETLRFLEEQTKKKESV